MAASKSARRRARQARAGRVTRTAGGKAANGGIVLKASVNVRTPAGRFPEGSYAAALLPARDSLQRDVRRAFDTQADPVTGRKWPPRKGDYPWPMLVKSGAMQQEAIKAAAAATINGNTLTAKMVVPKYAKFQQQGTRLVARRRFLGASIGTLAVVGNGLRAEGVKVTRGRR